MRSRPIRCLLAFSIAALFLCLGTVTSKAFPSWIGVYGNTQHQANGDPGVYTILMNQDYVGLHANVGVQINGGNWSEYSMTYSGSQDGNSKWTFTPSLVYPAGAVIKYYFHGYEDSSQSSIYDNNNGANYSYTAAGPSTQAIASNLDVLGNVFTLGAGSDDFTQPGLFLNYTDGSASVPSTVTFTSNRWHNNWTWQHGTYYGAQSGVATMMKLDTGNRLTLFKPDQSSDQPVIVLDPSLGQITINGQPIGNGGGSGSSTTLVVGAGNTASGQDSAAFGNGTTAYGYSQVVLGQYNAGGTENPTQRVNTDAAFVIGNGTSSSQKSNAFSVTWDGTTSVSGVLKAKGGILVPQQGDLSMGVYTSGATP